MASMTVSEARAALPELLSRVEGGEEITITRHGRAAAVLVNPGALRARHARAAFAVADQIGEQLEAARTRHRPRSRSTGLTADQAEEMVAEIRAGRDTR